MNIKKMFKKGDERSLYLRWLLLISLIMILAYSFGRNDGYGNGFTKGQEKGYSVGYMDAYNLNLDDEFINGYHTGFEDGSYATTED